MSVKLVSEVLQELLDPQILAIFCLEIGWGAWEQIKFQKTAGNLSMLAVHLSSHISEQ